MILVGSKKNQTFKNTFYAVQKLLKESLGILDKYAVNKYLVIYTIWWRRMDEVCEYFICIWNSSAIINTGRAN